MLSKLAFYISFQLISLVILAESCPEFCFCVGNFVKCNGQNLDNIPTDLPAWVEKLELIDNNLKNVTEFPSLLKLKHLDLSQNRISDLNAEIFQTPNLENLILKNNQFEDLPENLRLLKNLKVLILRSNRISSPNLANLAKIHMLDLSENRISEIKNVENTQLEIRFLNLDSNQITDLKPSTFVNFGKLKRLKLSRNQLKEIGTESFRGLKELIYLDLGHNPLLTTITSLTFRHLPLLRTLKLQRNSISRLEDGCFYGLSKLRTLRLGNNQLEVVYKGWLFGVGQLRELDLRNNLLSTIDPDSWRYCPHLASLNFNGNQLASLAEGSFKLLSELKELKIGQNKIELIEKGAFEGLGRLERLDLSQNRLSQTIAVSALFKTDDLVNLKILNLASNGLQNIEGEAFSGLKALKSLNLSSNPLISIDRQGFSGLEDLIEIHLDTTSLICDCNLDWITKYLEEFSFGNSKITLVCAGPPKFKGQNLIQIPVRELSCEGSPKPKISGDFPDKKIVLEGADVLMKCQIEIDSNENRIVETVIEWKKNGQLLYHDANSLEIKTSSPLFKRNNQKFQIISQMKIFDVRQSDTGSYQCWARNQYGVDRSGESQLVVQVHPKFIKIPGNTTAEVGRPAKFECLAEGHPDPEIRWHKDGGDKFPAAEERRLHLMPTDNTFYIVDIRHEDTGKYTCMATNAAGTVEADAWLTVFEKPTLKRPLANKTVEIGQAAALECMVDGVPKPSVSWFHNGDKINPLEDEGGRKYQLIADDQILIIVQVEVGDQGVYECEMKNQVAIIREKAVIRVFGGNIHNSKFLSSGSKNPNSNPKNNYSIAGQKDPVPKNSQESPWLPFNLDSPTGIAIICVFFIILMVVSLWVLLIFYRLWKRFSRRRQRIAMGCLEGATPKYLTNKDEIMLFEMGKMNEENPLTDPSNFDPSLLLLYGPSVDLTENRRYIDPNDPLLKFSTSVPPHKNDHFGTMPNLGQNRRMGPLMEMLDTMCPLLEPLEQGHHPINGNIMIRSAHNSSSLDSGVGREAKEGHLMVRAQDFSLNLDPLSPVLIPEGAGEEELVYGTVPLPIYQHYQPLTSPKSVIIQNPNRKRKKQNFSKTAQNTPCRQIEAGKSSHLITNYPKLSQQLALNNGSSNFELRTIAQNTEQNKLEPNLTTNFIQNQQRANDSVSNLTSTFRSNKDLS